MSFVKIYHIEFPQPAALSFEVQLATEPTITYREKRVDPVISTRLVQAL